MIPKRARGRPTAKAQARYEVEVEQFCDLILQINSSLDFRVSSRGWCYQLEEYGLGKGDFDQAQELINDCRKSGMLPLDICADDNARAAEHTELASATYNDTPVEDVVEIALEDIDNARQEAIDNAGQWYEPFQFWYTQDFYIEMLVEKIDLKELFKRICRKYCIPLGNSRGWPDINSRADMMRRFKEMEDQGKQCVLLYCGDHDPAGLNISESLRSMFADLTGAVGWNPENLIIDRFGLNTEFIEHNNLSWIEGLQTSSGKYLEDPKHPDHHKPYVQEYLKRFGPRKVEANALVTRAQAGRKLCLDAICKYVPEDAPEVYEVTVSQAQEEIKRMVLGRLNG